VRDRRALDILCQLMTDTDVADDKSIVPLDAWFSFWVLTGRTHGIESKHMFAKRPEPLKSEPELRNYAFRFAGRRGFTRERRALVNKFVRPSADAPNTKGLKEASDRSRLEFEAIEAEWKAESAE
jgi:hypothetical protein